MQRGHNTSFTKEKKLPNERLNSFRRNKNDLSEKKSAIQVKITLMYVLHWNGVIYVQWYKNYTQGTYNFAYYKWKSLCT